MPSLRPGRPEAAAAVWRPDAGRTQPDAAGHAAAARRRGLVRGLVGIAAGIALYFLWSQVVAGIAVTLGGLTLGTALASPTGAYARVERALAAFAGGVAQVVTFLAMTPVFFLVFLPFGLLTRRGAKDPLRRFYDPAQATYWTSREQIRRDYERQF